MSLRWKYALVTKYIYGQIYLWFWLLRIILKYHIYFQDIYYLSARGKIRESRVYVRTCLKHPPPRTTSSYPMLPRPPFSFNFPLHPPRFSLSLVHLYFSFFFIYFSPHTLYTVTHALSLSSHFWVFSLIRIHTLNECLLLFLQSSFPLLKNSPNVFSKGISLRRLCYCLCWWVVFTFHLFQLFSKL